MPTPVGNLEDLTFRGLSALLEAKVFFCEDTRVTKQLLHHLSTRFDVTFSPETFIPLHSHNERDVLETLEPSVFDRPCVYVSDAGTPCISDPGTALADHCIRHNIPFDVLPGANALLPGFIHSGFEGKFLFYGFLPHKGKDREKGLEEVLSCGYHGVLYESTHRIAKLVEELAAKAPEREICLAKELTKLHQAAHRGTAKEIAARFPEIDPRGEWVVTIKAGEKTAPGMELATTLAKLDLPKKQAAKLLSDLTGHPPKACYDAILKASDN